MAEINKIQQTEDLVDKKKADAEQVYNQAADVSGDSWADELMSDDIRKQPQAKSVTPTAPKGSGDDWADAMMSDDVRKAQQPAPQQAVEQNVQPAPVRQTPSVDSNLYKGEDLGEITVTLDKGSNKQTTSVAEPVPQEQPSKPLYDYTKAPEFKGEPDTWKYTKTIKTYDQKHPLAQAARHAKQYGDLLSAGELSSVYANKDWDDLNRQSQELMRKHSKTENTPEFEHDAQLLSAIHNQMVALEYNFADRNDMYKNIGQKNYRMFLEPMRKGNKYTEFYENLYNSGSDLSKSNPLLQYLPDKVYNQREADRKAGKEKPANYYFNMALKDKDFQERYHAWSFFGSIQKNMGWNEYKTLGAKANDIREEQYKEEAAKRFADSGWYVPVSALLDNSVAQAVMTVGNVYDIIKGQPLRSESVNDLLQRSMKYAGEGKNVARGVTSFIPDAISLMTGTGVAARGTVGALSKVITLTPKAMRFSTGGLSFMYYEMAKSALGSWSQGHEINWAEMAGNSAKGFLLGAGGSLISEGVAGIAPRVNSTVANYAIQGAGKVAETGLFASTEMAMAYLSNDKDATWTSSLLNNGALIISMAIGHGIGNGFGFKSRISNGTIEKVRKAGYNTLADEMARHTQAVERGAMPKGYSEAAIEELQSLQQSMGSNGFSWSDYAEVLKPTNSIMTKPGTNSIEKVEDGKGFRIVSYDVNGVEIERSKVYDKTSFDKEFAKRQRKVEKKKETANVEAFDLMRDSTIKAKAARSVADRINADDGKSVYNEDGTVNEAFDGVTADDILYAYETLSERPSEELSADEARLLSMFDEAARGYGDELPDSNAVKKIICERYGIKEDAFDKAWEDEASKRKDKEAEACAAYNSAMARPYEVALDGGQTGTVDGRQVSIKNAVKTDAEGMPLDPNQTVYYDDGAGVKVTTAEHVLMEPTAEDPGVLGDRIANENLRKALEAKKEELKALFADIPTDVLENNLEMARTAVESGDDPDGSLRLSCLALEEEIQNRRALGLDEAPREVAEESAPIELDAEGNVVEETPASQEETVAPIEVNEQGEVVETEPAEAPKPENEMRPVEMDDAATERDRKINELLDFVGVKEEDRESYRESYLSNPEALEEDYNDYLAEVQKETPQTQNPVAEVAPTPKEEPAVDNSQQEKKVVDSTDEPMPMLEDGEPNVDLATPKRTRHYLYEESGLEAQDATDKVDYEIKKAKDAVKKAEKGQPKMGDKGIDGNIGKFKKAQQEWNDRKNAADAKLEYWNEVKRQQGLYDLIAEIGEAKSPKSMAELVVKLKGRFKNDREMLNALNANAVEPKSLHEACMLYLSSGARFIWDGEGAKKGLKQELGWGEGERKKMYGMLSKDGTTIQGAVHDIVDQYGADLGIDLSRSQDVYNALIEALGSVSTRGDVFAFINSRRLQAVEDILRKRLGNGEVRSREDAEADARADEEYNAFVEEYRDELPENFTQDDVFRLMEQKRQEQESPSVEEQQQTTEASNEEITDDFFNQGDDYVPFRDGEGERKGSIKSEKNIERVGRSDRKDVPLRERTRESYTRRDGTYVEGLEDELQRLEAELRQAEERAGDDNQEVGDNSRVQNDEKAGRRGEDSLIGEPHNTTSLTNRISLIRRELAARDRTREEYKKKYGIADNGDVSIENVAKMFHDFNSNEAVGELFEKVYNVLKGLKNDFRVSDSVSPLYRGQAAEYYKMAFYNWDALVRGRDAQGKARTLLHEMIHNAATHVISSYEEPLLRMLLSPSQRRAAKTFLDIYERVKAEDLRDSKGKRFYGLKSANEMIAELANPEFREALKNIEYNNRSIWQILKDSFKKLFGLEVPAQGGNALDEASKALDNVLDSYRGINRIIRNTPRAIYDTYQATKGKNPVDVVESGLNDASQNTKADRNESGELFRDSETPTFYSNAERAVENIKQNKATAEQWLAMIKKNGGLKSGEDKWMGLSQWLEDNKGKSLTKEEVQQFIADNGIRMAERDYAKEEYQDNPNFKKLQEEYSSVYRQALKDREKARTDLDIFSDEMTKKYGTEYWGSLLEQSERNRLMELENAVRGHIEDAAMEEMVERYGDDFRSGFYPIRGNLFFYQSYDGVPSDEAQYYLDITTTPINPIRIDYTTKGLDKKREIAFVLPDVQSYQEHDDIHFGPENQGKAVMWVRFGETNTAPRNGYASADIMNELEKKYGDADAYDKMSDKDAAKRFFANYVERGENADMDVSRMEMEQTLGKERMDKVYPLFEDMVDNIANGKRVLVIDEIQSNRHQDAREKGYRPKKDSSELKDAVNVAQEKYDAFTKQMKDKYNGDYADVYAGDMTDAERKQADILEQAVYTASDAYEQSVSGVPDAPFEKNWYEVAMKRMLRYAAENGYDKVAWTTGEQQAKRYEIGNVVKHVVSEPYEAQSPSESNGHDLFLELNDGTIHEMFVQPDGTLNSNSEMFDGKNVREVFGKELGEKIASATERTEIEGEGLRIGGEGMKGFYDNILPRFMDKYGKRWGVKTGTVELPNVEEAGRTMHSVDVTPEMKESVMQGQPLFRQQEPLGERGVKKVTVVSEPEYVESNNYFGEPFTYRKSAGEYQVEGMGETFNGIEAAVDAVRKRNPDYCVYLDDEGNIQLEAWSNLLPDGIKPNTYAKVIAMSGGKMSSAMKKRIARYTEREMQQARTRAEELTKELGLDVEFHDDPNEFEGRKAKAKGWYDPKTGKIHIVMGNHSGVGDVMATMLHEGVAHYGLRKLFGDDFNTFLDNVADNVGEEIYKDIALRASDLASKDNNRHSLDWYRRAATEEYIAELAEDGLYNAEKNGSYAMRAWEWIKESFLNMLRKAGFHMELTDDELRYVLWSSHNNLRRGAEAMAKDAVMREKAGIKEYVEDGEKIGAAAERGEQLSLFGEKEPPASLGHAKEMSDRALLKEIGKDRYDVESLYADEYDRRHEKEYYEEWDNTTKMLEDSNTTINQAGDMLIDAAYDLRNKYTGRERTAAKARYEAIQDYYLNKEVAIDKARNDFFTEHEDELKERFGDNYFEDESIDKLMSEYGMAAGEPRVRYSATTEARKILRGDDTRYREGEEENAPSSDLASRMRERMRQRMERARAAQGGGEPPVEPPTPPAAPTPEPEPQLPPTAFDRPMTPIEIAKEAAIKAVADTKASLERRNEARRELDASLKNIHKAMRLQKEYDRTTVENVVALAKMMVKSGLVDRSYISNLTPLFTKIKDVNGMTPQGVTSVVNDIMDVMLKSQERSIRNELAKLMKITGTKVDENGVVKQAGLDIRGQHTMSEFKEYMDKGSQIIDRRIERLEEMRERVSEDDTERLDEIDDKILGCQLAKQYSEIEETHSVNISEAEEDLNYLKQRYKAGEMGIKEYTEQKHSLENLIRSYRMAQADALWNQINAINWVITDSKAESRNWVARQKERQNEIRHDAYRDMQGTPSYTQGDNTKMQEIANSALPKFFSSSLFTLQTMLKSLGNKHAMGEGYLYNRFFRGWMENRDAEITEYRDDMKTLDAKAKELTGKTYFGIYNMIKDLPTMSVEYYDGGEMRPHELDQGQLGYAYMVNKMEDGAAALRNMGITEEKMQEIAAFLNPNLKKFYDWLQDDFLAGKWDGMNEVHKRLFGADMDRVENYIPLRRDREAGKQKVDISQENEQQLQSTVVGSIIKRIHSNLGIDLKHNNAIDVVANHLLEATHWKHFSEWKRDSNSLLSDTKFRNKVKNSTTIYGSGKILWERLNQVFQIAGGDYKPSAKSSSIDKAIVDMARTVNTAKVSMRVFTATKQLLSLPVFATECNTATLLKNVGFLLSPDKVSGSPTQNSFVWCMENLPQFRERWVSRIAGETRLENGDLGWGYSRQKVLEAAGRIGLTPNAFIDACTVAAGAKSIYEKRYKQYRKDGFDEYKADKKAKIDAEVAFNESQQSSEKAFVSPLQVDRTAVALGLSTFRNASMGYERKFVDAVRNFKHLTMGGKEYKEILVKRKEKELIAQGMDKAEARAAAEKEYKHMLGAKAYREVTMEFMKKQMVDDGLTETQAKDAAERLYRRALWRSTLNFLMFGFGAQMAWNVGGKLPYLIFGDDDEEKKEIVEQAAVHAGIGGWVEGLPAGDMLSEGMTNWAMNLIESGNPLDGKSFFEFDPDLLTVTSDAVKVTKYLEGKNPLKGATAFVNLLGQIYTGVNPETFTDAGVAIYDACGGDPKVGNEALMCILRIMQCPQSQLDQMYIDELKMSAREAQKLSPEDVARRYAYYKAYKDTPYMWWMYNQGKKDEIVKKYEGDFTKKLNEDVKEAGGLPEDYFDLMGSATTKKRHDDLKNKGIDALAEQGPEALMNAYEKERAKGAAADYNVMNSIMSRYQKIVYGEEKMPDPSEVAYEAKHDVDLGKQAEKIGRDLGFGAQDSYFQMSKYKTDHSSKKDPVMKEFNGNDGGFKYSKKGKFFNMEDYSYKVPVKDVAKREKVLKVMKDHKEELRRSYRNGWRIQRIKALYEDIEAESLKATRDSKAMQKNFEEILHILDDERKDAEQWEKKTKK